MSSAGISQLMPRQIYTIRKEDGGLLTIEPGAMGPDSLRIGEVTWSLQLLADIGDAGFETLPGEAVRVIMKNGRRVFERVKVKP